MKSNDAPVLGVKPTPGITPEQARDARARAWKFIFDAYRKKAAEQGNGKTKQKS